MEIGMRGGLKLKEFAVEGAGVDVEGRCGGRAVGEGSWKEGVVGEGGVGGWLVGGGWRRCGGIVISGASGG